MRVSVVIPAYNAEPFIEATIASALGQDFDDLEIVVVDDGSSDRTRAVIAAIGSPRVRLLGGERRGVSAARNEGVRAGRGEYVAFLDHDDLWEPDKIRRQVAILDGDAGAGLVFTQARPVEAGSGAAHGAIFPVLPDAARFLSRAYENLVHWNYIPLSAVMVRRAILGEHPGPFDPRYALSEDWDLWLRIAAGLPEGGIAFIGEPLTRYVIQPGRATSRMADLRLEDLAIFEAQVGSHPWLERNDPRRVRRTREKLQREAAYWLLAEGRVREARAILRAAFRRRPASLGLWKLAAASVLRRSPS
jgi:glycosyltransferase involved in cell wall biosynthesis